jgi:hypothetical protein
MSQRGGPGPVGSPLAGPGSAVGSPAAAGTGAAAAAAAVEAKDISLKGIFLLLMCAIPAR